MVAFVIDWLHIYYRLCIMTSPPHKVNIDVSVDGCSWCMCAAMIFHQASRYTATNPKTSSVVKWVNFYEQF